VGDTRGCDRIAPIPDRMDCQVAVGVTGRGARAAESDSLLMN
jgi:hypothetical protein